MLSYTGEIICRNTPPLSPVSFDLDVQKPFLETYIQGLITWTQLLPSLSQSHVCTKQCPHHHESGHQLLCFASSDILLLSYVGPHKGNPMPAEKVPSLALAQCYKFSLWTWPCLPIHYTN